MPINRTQNVKKSVGRHSKGNDYFQWVSTLKKGKVDDQRKSVHTKNRLRHVNKASNALREAASQRKPKKRSARTEKTKPNDKLVYGAYRKSLYVVLRYLLFVMLVMGQLPFYFRQSKLVTTIRFKYKHPIFFVAVFICACSWILFLWMGVGMFTINRLSSDPAEENKIENDMSHRFWLGYWIIWFIFLHLAVSSTEFVFRAEKIAKFLKELLQVVEEMKMDVTKKLRRLLITNLVLMILAVITIVVLYNMVDTFPWIFGISGLLIQILARPIWNEKCDSALHDNNCRPKRYHEFAPYGLGLIIYAVIASRMYTTYFMTVCRVFRNSFHVSARRMEMCLKLEPKTEDAKRIDFENMFNDYYSITAMVHKFNKIHGFSAATYFFIQLMGFLVECFVISRYFGIDQKFYLNSLPTPSAQSPTNIPNEKQIIFFGAMYLMHLCITFFSCTYVSSVAAQVHRQILEYNGVLYRRGIVGNREPLERDFVRTMWMNCSHRHPVIISPMRLFGITPRFMTQFLGVTVIFLILMFPLPLLTKYAEWEEEQHVYFATHQDRASASHFRTIYFSRTGKHRPNTSDISHYLGDFVEPFVRMYLR